MTTPLVRIVDDDADARSSSSFFLFLSFQILSYVLYFCGKCSSRFAYLYRLYAAFLRNVCGKNIFLEKPLFLR